MCPGPMIVGAVRLQVAVQAGFVEDDDVIQTLSANGADYVVGICNVDVRAKHVLVADLHITAGVNHDVSIEVVIIANADACATMI